MSQSVNQLISDEGVCRTAPATPGLLKIAYTKKSIIKMAKVLYCRGASYLYGLHTCPAEVEAEFSLNSSSILPPAAPQAFLQ